VIAADPQYIILSDARSGTTVARVAARPGWSRISAVRHHHVYPFNDDLASRPGPRIVLGLETLARLLHPELFH
jgi:iron complex transport system substrate-binding protein